MLILVLFILLVALPRLITAWSTRSRVFTVDTAPVRRAAIVFGAGLWRDGSPTPVLRDRVATAAQLYLLLSQSFFDSLLILIWGRIWL